MRSRFQFLIMGLCMFVFFNLIYGSNQASSQVNDPALAKLEKAIERISLLENRISELEKQLKKEIVTKKITILSENEEKGFILETASKTIKNTNHSILGIYDDNNRGGVAIGVADSPESSYIILNGGDKFLSLIPDLHYIPSRNEWNLLQFIAAKNSNQYLTENLILESIDAFIKTETIDSEKGISKNILMIYPSTYTQPIWGGYYVGKGKFNLSDREIKGEYLQAGNKIKKWVQDYIPEDTYDTIRIFFDIKGYEVGVWEDGAMKLKGE